MSETAPARTKETTARDGTAKENRVNVLLVDDQEENLFALESFLEDLGQNIVRARSGREALKYLLAGYEFAVILLDVFMPDMDGFETARLIRSREASRQVPIIFLTAADRSDAQVFRGYAVGAVDYLHKPFEPEVLKSKVTVFVELAKKSDLVRRQAEALRESERREHERQIAETTQRLEAESYRIKAELVAKEMEAAQARAALELAETRARFASDLERKNRELERAKQTAERESQFKTKFLMRMSHELRTPLNAIIGFSELMEQEIVGPLNPTQREYVGLVLQSGKHLLDLVNDILDLSKVEAGRLDLVREWTTFEVLASEVQGVVLPLAQKQGVQLDVSLPRELPRIHVDPVRVREVLINLLSNGIKFTPSGGRVSLHARAAGDHVEFEVTDTGIGIRQEDLPRLFREFERIESPRAGVTQPEGTGLGLVITQRLVQLHGGTIAVASEVGRGTTVRVRLPIAAGSGRAA